MYRDECMFSFDTQFSPDGLYLNLRTFQVLCWGRVLLDLVFSYNLSVL